MNPASIALKAAYRNRPKITVGSQMTSAVLATGVGLGVFLGIRAVWKNFKKGIKQHEALIEGNPSSYATQIKMAFENDNSFGWGTDEELLFKTLERIPTQHMMRRVQRAYRVLYGSLGVDLKSELDNEEYAKALQLINSKP